MLVPIGKLAGRAVVVYSGGDRVEFQSIAPDARFQHHDEITARTLQGFDPQKHGLFGINPNDVLTYDLGDEARFYERLLRSSAAFYIEPFYRLSLAFETNDPGLIRPLYLRCAYHLRREAPDVFAPLLKSIPAATPLIARIQNEALQAVDAPRLPPAEAVFRHITESAAARTPREAFTVMPGPAMSAARISEAVRTLVYRERAGTTRWTSVHAVALRASLGFWGDRQANNTISGLALLEPNGAPSAHDVATISRLSLPHLEFANILLSKPTAVEFLSRAWAGVSRSVLLQDVLTQRFYERQFARPPAKVRQRAVFTYAEVLAMIKYAGLVEVV